MIEVAYQIPKYKRQGVRSATAVSRACEALSQAKIVGLDLETTGFDPKQCRVRLIQVADPQTKTTHVFDMFYVQDPTPICKFLLDPHVAKIGCNLKFDTKFLLHHYGVYPEKPLDIFLGSQLLRKINMSEKNPTAMDEDSHSLEAIALRYLNYQMDKTMGASDWSGELSDAQLDYAAKDVEILPDLLVELAKKLEAVGMGEAWVTENLYILSIAETELNGIYVDLAAAENLRKELYEHMEQASLIATEYLPSRQLTVFGAEPVNLNSSPQVIERVKELYGVDLVLEQTGKEAKASAAGKVMKLHRDKIPSAFIDMYTQNMTVSKAVPKIDRILSFRGPDGRVHPNWYQLGQPTHRPSCTSPNMLSMDRPDKLGPGVEFEGSLCKTKYGFRNLFKPVEGRKFVIADGDQLQVRILAQLSGDPLMCKTLIEGADMHTVTGCTIFGKNKNTLTKMERYCGKTVNFAAFYKAGPKRLQDAALGMYGLWKEIEEWAAIRDKFYESYKGLAMWQEHRIEIAKTEHRIFGGGRTIFLTDDSDYYVQAVNAPAVLMEQAGMKLAMGHVVRKVYQEKLDAFQVNSVYDEICMEVADKDAERVREIVQYELEKGLARYIKRVPVIAEAGICSDWSEK